MLVIWKFELSKMSAKEERKKERSRNCRLSLVAKYSVPNIS
jgi:hypothetical protein